MKKWRKYKHHFENADCQLHTKYTDGKSSPEEYFEQAEKNGLEFILFSEHVRKETTYDYLKFKEHVYRAGAKSSVKFAVGAEAKVLDLVGNIDISDEIAGEAEMVLFSFHTPNFHPIENYIEAIIKAAANPITDVFAHPTMYHNWQGVQMTQNHWTQILGGLEKGDVCYEFNKKYPLPSEEEIKALKLYNGTINYIYGSDAHQSSSLLDIKDINDFKSTVKK